MRLLFALLLIIFINFSAGYKINSKFTEQQYKTAFTEWTIKHGKQYENQEFGRRYGIFKDNMDYVHDWNSKGSETVLGLNIFADLTNLEYQKYYLGTHVNSLLHRGYDGRALEEIFGSDDGRNPTSVDWNKKGAVTPIKDQGQCGSCWSFSTTGSVEGAHQIKTGKLVSLSEQNLVDCSGAEGNLGCDGGLMDNAFIYIIQNKGIDTESSYPYKAQSGTKCLFKPTSIGATLSGYVNITAGSESQLETAVAKNGPVSVAIDASHNSFQLYSSGVYYEPKCSPTELDHGVLVVGYGVAKKDENNASPNKHQIRIRHNDDFGIDEIVTDSSSDDGRKTSQYWLVKNSWGVSWGMQGFIQMSKNRKNNCGIASCASYPTA
ncbi:hypothetical protein DICPUDRAFT_95775 [Dictyostelium purpureum]|uniref:Uncharacterized protein n=1 Tax=Dictyostelium purpureum TaxID=5786 RepID=F1A0L7_DICPU|nr:uncharacterized protein DICPUDRAFT_95775 [Dictyostelium purpureum]EGC30264.1 hypothetical protein DICPUDRAFT_95775 [Dictyostelium purpureum]|eukprot:XP_003293216.1 hypothetical protein DICPUDRAFT_95775 [Dictyostelium purpureum]